MIKLAVKEMQGAKFYAIILSSVMLVSLSPAFLTLLTHVVIRSTGRIGEDSVIAKSGSAEDIQVAVDQVAAMGGGNVYIPEGTFNFTDGAPWQTVYVPAGVSIFGAPTDRDANDQVIPPWKTILQMPWEAPDKSEWFEFNDGGGTSTEPTRFSDIKLVGYRNFDPTSTTMYAGVDINDIIGFRVDHCFFLDIARQAVVADSVDNGDCSGVIDHCKFVNTVGDPAPYSTRTVDYGVFVSPGSGTTRWESDISNVVGHYTNYTVFIEDCYFEKWRHDICSGWGAHYVFRHNTIQYDYGYGSIDCHGTYVNVPTRAVEVYENQILDCIGDHKVGMYFRGGGGCVFNNTVDDTHIRFITMQEDQLGDIADAYIWNNNLEPGVQLISSSVEEGVDYFLYAMPDYEPYPYPHPLTLEST